MIDTAEGYGDSEELIVKALSGRRDDYYLFTKSGHASGLDYPNWDPVMLAQSIDRSLKRLQVDHVDSGDSTDTLYTLLTGVFESFEASLNIADQEAIDLTIPLAMQQGIGIIPKRPVANVAWKHQTLSEQDYAYPYWVRLRAAAGGFLRVDPQSLASGCQCGLGGQGIGV
ncbi:aldo/keto reductase [Paenibacillus sp. 2KB_20]|uniref:aldo/keto reductase n=1 Tax=Paenibacillus sp. 2KB_20 TaxID=3232977 RepID=UPI003F9985C2